MAAESFDVELKLIDSVSAGARRAAKTVEDIGKNAKKTAKDLDFSKEVERAEAKLKKLQSDPSGYLKLIKARKDIAIQQKKLTEGGFMEGLFRGANPYGYGRVWSNVVGVAIGEGIVGAFTGAFDLIIGAAEKVVDVFKNGLKNAFKAASEEETLRVGERNTLGEAGGKAFREDIGSFDKLAPFDDSQIRAMMLRLRRAGLSQAASRQAFATAVDIGGGDTGAVGGVLEQFQRIYTKQGIGKKQLMELLGNVGTTIPDFYKALGAKMHISAKEAEKKAEQGGLDPQLLMNMITEAQNKRQGGIAGTGGFRYVQTLAGEWKKLSDLPGEYYKKLADSTGYHRAVEALGSLLEKLDPDSPTGRRIMAAVEDMFDKITDIIGDPATAAEQIASAITETISLVSRLLPSLSTMGDLLVSAAEAAAAGARQLRIAVDYSTYLTGGKEDLAKMKQEDADRRQEAVNKAAAKDMLARGQGITAGTFVNGLSKGLDPVTALMQTIPTAKAAADARNKVIQMHVVNHVSVNTNGEDANEAHEKAGHEVRKHLVSAAERAKAEIGG